MLRSTSCCLVRKIVCTYSRLTVCSAKLPFSSKATSHFPNNDPNTYKNYKTVRQVLLQSKLNHPNRFQSISERVDRSDWTAEMRKLQVPGKYMTVYRGCDILKTPEDFETYHQLFWYVRPATLIELGTYNGGMTLWMADTMKLIDNPCHIYTFDLDSSLLDDVAVKHINPNDVTFLQGDCYAIEETFTPKFLQQLPHPWVVIDDVHENSLNVWKHFHQFMKQGDYFVVEDTDPRIPNDYPSSLDDLYGAPVGTKKLEEVKNFLKQFEEHYAVDSFFTDLFGYNGTWHWHGFIKRMN